MDVRLLSTISTATSRASSAVQAVPTPVPTFTPAAAPVAAVQSDALQQVAGLGLFVANTNDEGLPRWKVLTALRVYGLNLKQGSERRAADESHVISAPQTDTYVVVEKQDAPEASATVQPASKVEVTA